MHFLDLTLPTLPENLALDEALLLEAEDGAGGEVLRFWEWPTPAVVLGAGGRLAEDVDEAACRMDAVPLGRRSSGGGTVLLGRGCLLFSLVLVYERAEPLRDITASYRFILQRVREALAGLGDIELAGISDLARAGRKVSGNAQQRKRHFVLHHGSLLYAFDVAGVSRYLRMPRRQPDYRQNRDHNAFLDNLPADRDDLRRRLWEVWGRPPERSDWPAERVRELVVEKYACPEWLRRR